MYVVAVRALCEFTAKRGDLDLRFTPSPTAEEGIAGHATVAARRGASRRSEVSLAGAHGDLLVRGRADGWDASRNVLEEVKTHRGDLARQPANHRALHWAQLKVYGALLTRQLGLAEVTLALVYFDVATQRETVFSETHDAAALQACFADCCDRFVAWARQELDHAARRDAALANLRFPHAGFRPGQRRLAEQVYRAAKHGRCLLAQAPTGIGKTVATLFPLLKAWPSHGLHKVLFLTAKGTGRPLALDAARRLREAGGIDGRTPLRVLELVARDKACEFPDRACHGESCPLAAGFYDRLPAARAAAVAADAPVLDGAALREVALAHGVCPYWLGQELARWADVIVGDVNHWYDVGSPLLHALALEHGWKVAVLVDEAHNLVERARTMYTASLDQRRLAAVRKVAPKGVKAALDRLHRAWNALHDDPTDDYAVLPALPDALVDALHGAIQRIGEHLADAPAGVDDELLAWQFEQAHFARLLDSYDAAHSMVDVTRVRDRGRIRSVLCVRNAIPAPFLRPRHAAAATTTLFSATLTPHDFHADVLGLPDDTAWLDVESPFGAHQLDVRIAGHVSTRWADRDASLPPIVELIAAQHDARPGNYLAFFSSFDYLDKAHALFAARRPDIATWRQSRGMSADDRARFLARFDDDPGGAGGVAFAVLGGAFGEGIDLPGERLIGAFVATLGLPPLNPVNEQMKLRMDGAFGRGHEYTYLYPGLQKVVQAAGRVIRTEHDRGVVVLIDDRYARPAVQRLLPAWWRVASG